MKVGVIINNLELDLFQDENIEITQNIQNIKDITKFYSDYTQNFNVPASKKNNIVFAHWYNADIDQFDANIKQVGRLEVDGFVFKEGVFTLEKANIKDGKIYSYTINFSTTIAVLKDIFQDDKLNDVTYQDFEYNATNIKTLITQSTTDLLVTGTIFPLISSKNLWSYNDAGPSDINTVSGAVKWNELYPALSLRLIFEKISNQYSIDFGDYISDSNVMNEYNFIWFKNKPLKSNIIPIQGTEQKFPVFFPSNTIPSNGKDATYKKIFVQINSSYTGQFTLKLYKNGILINSLTFQSQTGVQLYYLHGSSPWTYDTYQVGIVADSSFTYDIRIIAELPWWDEGASATAFYQQYWEYLGQTTTGNLNLKYLAPSVKIIDFIKQYLTLINGVIYFENGKYIIEPLERYYARGNVVDITSMVSVDSIDFTNIKQPKKLTFKHAENKAITNVNYNEYNEPIMYGNAISGYESDGAELVFESGFEVTKIDKINPTSNVRLGYSLDKDLKEITPKCQLLGATTRMIADIKYWNGTTTETLASHIMVSNVFLSYSNTFSVEDGFTGTEVDTLFSVFYEPYISGLFNKKNRQVSLKGKLKTTDFANLKLYDTVEFQQKLYVISDIKISLVNGNFTANLVSNFRTQPKFIQYNFDETGGVITHELQVDATGVWYTNHVIPTWSTLTGLIDINVDPLPLGVDFRFYNFGYTAHNGLTPTTERYFIKVVQQRTIVTENYILTENGTEIETETGGQLFITE